MKQKSIESQLMARARNSVASVIKRPSQISTLMGKAMAGNPSAQFMMGMLNISRGCFSTASKWFMRSCKDLDSKSDQPKVTYDAAHNLAILYEHGIGVKKDIDKAVRLNSIVGKVDPAGFYNVGRILFESGGDRRSALDFALQARRIISGPLAGEPQRLAALILFNGGENVQRDPVRAEALLREGADRGNGHCELFLGQILAGKSEPGATTEAALWINSAVKKGIPGANEAATQLKRTLGDILPRRHGGPETQQRVWLN